jgi:hypothetical protein
MCNLCRHRRIFLYKFSKLLYESFGAFVQIFKKLLINILIKASLFLFTPQHLLPSLMAVKGVKGKKSHFYFIAIGFSSSLIINWLEPPLAKPSIPLGEASFT